MATPPRDQVESAIAELVKEALAANQSVRIPGLGTFEVRHHHSEMVRSETGELTMTPPHDEVVFEFEGPAPTD